MPSEINFLKIFSVFSKKFIIYFYTKRVDYSTNIFCIFIEREHIFSDIFIIKK